MSYDHRSLPAGVFLIFWLELLLPIGSLLADDLQSSQHLFNQAQEKFDSAKSREEFGEAGRMFERILDGEKENGTVRFNAGNAYFRAEEYGRAILNYRKAKLLRPTDPYVLSNLEQALNLAPGRLPEPPLPGWKRLFFWHEWFSPSAKIWIATVGFCLIAITFLIAEVVQYKSFRWLSLGLLLLCLIVGLDAWMTNDELTNSKIGVVVIDTIARKGMGDDYAPAFDQPLKDGAEFTILSATPSWTLGHFNNIGDGWVRNDAIAR